MSSTRCRSDELLGEDVSLEDARLRHARVGLRERDDITTALYFHVGAFPGIDEEVDSLVEMVGFLEPGLDPARGNPFRWRSR